MINDNDDSSDEEFIVSEVSEEERGYVVNSCQYLEELMNSTGLEILKKNLVHREYEERKEQGLFNVFLNQTFVECVRLWTNVELFKKGKKIVSKELFNAYIGLELAMSISKLNHIRDYWSTKMFLGNVDFKRIMCRDRFKDIRSSLCFYPEYDHEIAVLDPLCHSRIMLQHFLKNASSVAVPKGCSAPDENTVRCKARTGARSYMKSKPVRFGIRFYAVVGSKHAYLHSLWDNGSGNKTNVPPEQMYCNVFRDLRGTYYRCMTIVDPNSTSALWCMHMVHQTKLSKQSNEKRILFMDNFYTRHILANQLELLSEGDIRVIGTVLFNNVDSVNRPRLKEAYSTIASKPRGYWLLVQTYNQPFLPGQRRRIAQNTGYIVFKDRNVVTFYTNDLYGTP